MDKGKRRSLERRSKRQALGRLRTGRCRIPNSPEITDREVGIHSRTPKTCSCRMCGNFRKHEGVPHTERKQLERINDWEVNDESNT